MYTSAIAVALVTWLAGSPVPEGPTWSRDYFAARKQGAQEKKPLAVVFGSGERGQGKLSKEGNLTKEVLDHLAKHYCCVYIDTATNQNLTSSFGIYKGTGLVLSNRSGELQAFHYDGALSNADLLRYLQRFADAGVTVRTTATHEVVERTSYYPPQSSPTTTSLPQSFRSVGGGNC